jgi:hypothetical protein
MKAAMKGNGPFDATICKLESKPKSDQTYPHVCSFILKRFSKANTCRQKAQAFGFGIANNTKTTNPFNVNTTNLVLKTTAELVNAVTNQNKKSWTSSSNSKQRHSTPFRNFSQSPMPQPPTTLAPTNAHTTGNALIVNIISPTSLETNTGNFPPMVPCT